MSLDSIQLKKKTGEEEITNPYKRSSLINFWQWAYSDLVSNTERGIYAEYLVALACNIDDKPRISWDTYDLELNNGVKMEVKSSAYLQSWQQKAFSKPIFRIQKTLAWDYREKADGNVKKRHADVYVFALLAHKEKQTIDPLDTNQWEFYVLHTHSINEKLGEAKQISLNELIKMGAFKCAFADLLDVINGIMKLSSDQLI